MKTKTTPHPNIVLILGVPRSGTTYLLKRLAKLIGFQAISEPFRSCVTPTKINFPEEISVSLSRLASLDEDPQILIDKLIKNHSKIECELLAKGGLIIKETLHFPWNHEKTISHIDSLPSLFWPMSILQDEPSNVSTVYLTRNPINTLNSALHYVSKLYRRPLTKTEKQELILTTANSANRAYACYKKLKCTLFIYEEICEAQDRTLQKRMGLNSNLSESKLSKSNFFGIGDIDARANSTSYKPLAKELVITKEDINLYGKNLSEATRCFYNKIYKGLEFN